MDVDDGESDGDQGKSVRWRHAVQFPWLEEKRRGLGGEMRSCRHGW